MASGGTHPVSVGPGDGVARAAVEAVRAQSRRVLLSRGWAVLAVADDQDDCLAVGELNHHALFPQVAAVLHHGGAGKIGFGPFRPALREQAKVDAK